MRDLFKSLALDDLVDFSESSQSLTESLEDGQHDECHLFELEEVCFCWVGIRRCQCLGFMYNKSRKNQNRFLGYFNFKTYHAHG